MNSGNLALFILCAVLVLGLTMVALILFIRHFQKTLTDVYEEKKETEIRFLHEIHQAKMEIQDKTLSHVGRELHDNIGQLLTVSNIHAMALRQADPENKKLEALQDAVQQAIVEVKALSKSLDSSRLENFGLHHEVRNEVDRLQKLQVAQIQFEIQGNHDLKKESAILLLRVVQEFLQNSIKHSGGNLCEVKFNYQTLYLQVTLSDNGKGFNLEGYSNSSGLHSIRTRLNLLQAKEVEFNSSNQGTLLTFKLYYHHD